MKNVLRCLIYDEQVSLTVLDTTEIVKRGIELHNLSPAAAVVLGKTLTVTTYMSACLKEERGAVSVALTGNGLGGSIGVSGDYFLRMRGYVQNADVSCDVNEAETALLGNEGTVTVVRDDGYSRPFVGACAYTENALVDRVFEEYYRTSEQLPTYISTLVKLDEKGACVFAGAIVLQPLPFAEQSILDKLPTGKALDEITALLPELGIAGVAKERFAAMSDSFEFKAAEYKCHCSRAYLSEVLASLGEAEMRKIIKEDGCIKVHCHYCNTEYVFTEEDVETVFKREN